MINGIIGKKVGMTQIFAEDGTVTGVQVRDVVDSGAPTPAQQHGHVGPRQPVDEVGAPFAP